MTPYSDSTRSPVSGPKRLQFPLHPSPPFISCVTVESEQPTEPSAVLGNLTTREQSSVGLRGNAIATLAELCVDPVNCCEHSVCSSSTPLNGPSHIRHSRMTCSQNRPPTLSSSYQHLQSLSAPSLELTDITAKSRLAAPRHPSCRLYNARIPAARKEPILQHTTHQHTL